MSISSTPSVFLGIISIINLSAFVLVQTAFAAEPLINKPTVAYEVLAINSEIAEERLYLGELIGEPHMYEFSLGKSTKLAVTLVQLSEAETIPFSLIVVRLKDNNRGVTEVGRLSGEETDWEEYHDSALALDLKRGESFETELGSGIYRVEVSTPVNFGKYMLVVGDESLEYGYFDTIEHIRTVQEFFDISALRMVISSYVYYPLGIVALLLALLVTWRKRYLILGDKKDTHA